MEADQPPDRPGLFVRASPRQRLAAAAVFGAIVALFAIFWLAAHFKIAIWPFACGFKQQYGLPCPTCGMTTAVLAFAHGQVLKALYTQPAAALLCCFLVLTAFFAFLTAVFGVYLSAFVGLAGKLRIKFVLLVLLIVLAAGWAVTLVRAIAAGHPH
jgi:hypothetical protein